MTVIMVTTPLREWGEMDDDDDNVDNSVADHAVEQVARVIEVDRDDPRYLDTRFWPKFTPSGSEDDRKDCAEWIKLRLEQVAASRETITLSDNSPRVRSSAVKTTSEIVADGLLRQS